MPKHFFELMASEFSHGNLYAIARRFKYPAAIYLDEETLVFHSAKEMGEALAAYKKRLSAFEYASTKAQVLASTPKRRNTRIIWVKWFHYDADGNEIDQSSIKYFCCDAEDGGMLIQLGEYTSTPAVCSALNSQSVVQKNMAYLH